MPEYEKEEKNLVLPFEFKAVGEPDKNGLVDFDGHAAAFNNVDLGGDVIVKGAFAETIKEDPNVPIYLDHIALMRETTGFNKTAVEDGFGLRVTGQLNTKLEAGKIAYELSKQAMALGKKIGLSIGYGTKEKEIDPDTGVRTLKKLKLYEYSFTNHPMNTLASFNAFKSRRVNELKTALKELIKEDPDFFTKEMTEGEVIKQVGDEFGSQLKDLLESIKNTTSIIKQ